MEPPDPVDPDTLPRAVLRRIEPLVESGRLTEAAALLAPLARRFPTDFWVRRMQARATADPVLALQLWQAQLVAFPNEAQSHIDLAQALRDHVRDDAMADAVLMSAVQRFPAQLWIMDALAVAAERRGDAQEAARWWSLTVEHHPGHDRGHAGLMAALARLGMRAEMEALLRQQAARDPRNAVLMQRLAELAEPEPLQALESWGQLRALHPTIAAGHLGFARALQALGRAEECDEILTAAHRLLPANPDIAVAWATDAARRLDWPAALERARMLRPLAPDWRATALIEGEALIETGDPPAALAVLGPARARFPDEFWLAYHEVRALNLLGQFQAAHKAGRALFDGFPTEPFACAGLADALERLGRPSEAEAVLLEARARFPDQSWLAVRLAQAAWARDDAAAAVSCWREAGLPAIGTGEQLRLFALALSRAGLAAEALAVLRTKSGGTADQAWLRLGQAERLVAGGRWSEALALWPSLRDAFSLTVAEFAALTWSLACQLDPAAAPPLLRALLDEPDQDGADWCPALGRALARSGAGDPVHGRLRAMLNDRLRAMLHDQARPEQPTIAWAIADSLAGAEPDTDALSLRVQRAVRDGRPQIMAPLLDNAGNPDRAHRLRIALRLALNRMLGAADAWPNLPPAQVLALLAVARVADVECFDYVALLARDRFPRAVPPLLPRAEDVVGCIAHRRLQDERSPPANPLPARLSVAVCVHGHATAGLPEQPLIEALSLRHHDTRVFAHLWHDTVGPVPDDDAAIARLPELLRAAVREAAANLGAEAMRALYPDLLALDTITPSFDPASSAPRYGEAKLVVEAADAPHLQGRSVAWRARFKAMQAHQMAIGSGVAFDLVLHVAADAVPAVPDTTDWRAIAEAARARGVVFADQQLHFRRDAALAMGAILVAGTVADMSVAADSFEMAEFIASGQARIAGWPTEDIQRHSQPLLLHLMGVPVEALPGVTCPQPRPPALPALNAAASLGLLWRTLQTRAPVPQDVRLLRAVIADTTGGIAP